METNRAFDGTNLDAMMRFVSSVLAELNIGLLIFHLEDPSEAHSLRLLYANHAASEYTEADLTPLIGQTILEAFPALTDSGLPETYAEVVRNQKSCNVGAFEYEGDGNVAKGHYAVKAFPMPNDCVGIAFENITVRRQLEDLVKKMREKETRR